MISSIKDFTVVWKSEFESTIKIFERISDDLITKKVHEDVRDLGRLAWHITQTIHEMANRSGLIPEDILEGKPVPSSIAEIIETYKLASEKMITLVSESWNDEMLNGEIEVYGQKWQRGQILSVLITHQIHHRAQMTVIMRILAIEVPGIYGPAKHEWAKYGMKPHE